MTDYIDLNLEADPTVLRQNARDWITSQAPDGYIVDPWTDWILGAVARMAVEVVVLTSRVPLVVFREFGQRVLQIPALDATSATGVVTVTAVNTDGFLPDGSPYTLPAGADFDIDEKQFQSVVPVTVVSGQTTATVPVIAVVAGLAGSGLTGADDARQPDGAVGSVGRPRLPDPRWAGRGDGRGVCLLVRGRDPDLVAVGDPARRLRDARPPRPRGDPRTRCEGLRARRPAAALSPPPRGRHR